jgi:hemerythrin superfamily protein
MKQKREQTDAVQMIKADHQKVQTLFSQIESSTQEDRQTLATQLFNELEVHALLEEEIFYPAVRDGIDLKELAGIEGTEDDDEADTAEGENIITLSYEEHRAIKDLIQELKGMDGASPEFGERLEELKEDVLTHASEEEDVILPAAAIKLDVEALGRQMQNRRIELVAALAGNR